MGQLKGVSMAGVGADIVSYLTEVAKYFDVNLQVTSGHRTADGQAAAMLNNWLKLNRGGDYSRAALPDKDRLKLDEYFNTTKRAGVNVKDSGEAKAQFLKLAKERLGARSLHTRGRAVDIAQAGVPKAVYQAITLHMKEVPEGKPPRKDIFHFQAETVIPAVNDATKAKWKAIEEGKIIDSRNTHLPSGQDSFCLC